MSNKKVYSFVNGGPYCRLQEEVFGKAYAQSVLEGVGCGSVTPSDKADLCREVAGGDGEASASELVRWAALSAEGFRKKYPSLASLRPTSSDKMYFNERLPKEVLEASGVRIDAKLTRYANSIPAIEYWGYPMEGKGDRVDVGGRSIKLYLHPFKRGSARVLLLQSVFNMLCDEIAGLFSSGRKGL